MLELQLFSIPAALRNLDQWLVWSLETRGGKSTKVPYDAKTGAKGKSNDPATWCGFHQAARAAKQDGCYDGIGFAFRAGDGLVGIDLDHVYDAATGTLDPKAADILEWFQGTYAEISPSGAGIRIFCYGKPGRTGKNEGKPKWAEVYDHSSPRYLTVTGHRWEGSAPDITPQQAALDRLHRQFFLAAAPGSVSPAQAKPQPRGGLTLDDAELVRRAEASRNGGRFRALMAGDAGDDHSAADLALCTLLAFWCQRDADRIDRIFRTSGLMRDKWDKKHSSDGRTYGRMTVDRAVRDCREVYTPHGPGPARGGSPGSLPGEVPPMGAGPDGDGAEPPDQRPEIRLGGDRLITAMQDAERVLFQGRERSPPFFIKGGMLMRINRVNLRRERHGQVLEIPNSLKLEPVSADWLQVEMMRRCKFMAAKERFNSATGEVEIAWKPTNLPAQYPKSYCAWGIGEWWAPQLRAVVEAPVLRLDGSIIHKPGFDPKSGLYLDSEVAWELPAKRAKGAKIQPPQDEPVRWAVNLFEDLFYGPERFSPETPADFSAMVAAVLTALVKTEIGAAPGFVVTAPGPGSGKGKFADIVSIVKTGQRCAMQNVPTDKKGNQDEVKFADKLFAALYGGAGFICVDEVQRTLDSPTLRTLLTQEEYEDRIKGLSKMATVKPLDALYMVLGNNLTMNADDARRWVRIYLNPKCSEPWKREFKRDAILHAMENRVRIVQAGLTLMQSYLLAGAPDMGCKLGGFERWAALVPSCLVWAGLPDPCETMAVWLAQDEDRQRLAGLLEAWHRRYPNKGVTCSEVGKELKERPNTPENKEFAEFLAEHWGEKTGINTRRLGNYIAARVERRADGGMWFAKDGTAQRAVKWRAMK